MPLGASPGGGGFFRLYRTSPLKYQNFLSDLSRVFGPLKVLATMPFSPEPRFPVHYYIPNFFFDLVAKVSESPAKFHLILTQGILN